MKKAAETVVQNLISKYGIASVRDQKTNLQCKNDRKK